MKSNDTQQTDSFTILEQALLTYEQWHVKIGFSFRALFGTGTFPGILQAAGYDARGLSNAGCFFVPVQRQPLITAIEKILSETDDQLLEYSAIFLAGVLNAVELVPVILASVRRNAEYSVAPFLAARTLYILGCSAGEVVSFIREHSVKPGQTALLSLLVQIELEIPGKEPAKRADETLRQLIAELPNDAQGADVPGAIFRCAAEIQRRGVDTSDLCEHILEKRYRQLPITDRANWVFAVGSTELFRKVFHRAELLEVTIELLCQAVENEVKRALIRPIVLEMQVQLTAHEELALALLPLLKLCGVDVSAYSQDDNWALRCGAYLAETVEDASPRETREYLSLLAREEDREVRFALSLNYLLRSDSPGVAAMADFDQLYRKAYGELPRVTRAIVSGCGLSEQFATVALDQFLGEYRSRTELKERLRGDEHFFVSRFLSRDEKWPQALFDSFHHGSPAEMNILLHAMDAPDRNVDRYLQELFLDCSSDADAYAMMIVAEARGIPFDSFLARTKAKVLRSNPTEVQLDKDEFEILFPSLLNESLEQSLLLPLIRSCRLMLQQYPDKAMAIMRSMWHEDEVLQEIVKLITPAEGDGLSVALANARQGVYHKDFPIAARLFGSSKEIVSDVVKNEPPELHDPHLLLMLTQDTDGYSLETVETLYRLLLEELSLQDQAGFFAGRVQKMNDTEQLATAKYVSRQPEPIFAPVLKYLFDRPYEDVRKAAHAAADRLVANTAAKLPVASLVREPLEQAVLNARAHMDDPELYQRHMDRLCIIYLIDIESPSPREITAEALMPVSMIRNLILYMHVDYADEKREAVVARVGAQETTETLSWLMEQHGVVHFVVQ